MASGYVGETTNTYSLRIRWSSVYHPEGNYSIVTLTPQEKGGANFGGTMLGTAYGISGGGVYANGSMIYALDGSYGGSARNLSRGASDSWGDFTPTVGSIPTIRVNHDSSGNASLTARVYATVLPYNFPQTESYRKVIDTGNAAISIHENAPYSISYSANGGSGAPSSQGVYYGVSYTLSSTRPTRTGYTFLGWATSDSATIAEYQPGDSVTPNGNLALYAVWSINSYNVSLTAGDNIALVSGAGSKVYNSAVTVEAVLATATGYTYAFDGWYKDGAKVSSNASYSFSMPAEAVSLTAIGIRSVNPYTVEFNANGGTGTMQDQDFVYDTAQDLTPNAFTRTGYTFLGWSADPSATVPTYSDEESVSNLVPSGTIVLYAVWRLDTYLLSISASNSTVTVVRTSSPIGGGSIGNISAGAALYYNDVLTITFTARAGYTQAAHTVNGTDFTSGDTHVVAAGVAVVSTATANNYTVVYNANRGGAHGSGEMPDQAFVYDTPQKLTANTFTRFFVATFDANGGTAGDNSEDVHSAFLGWSRSASGSAQYTDEQSVSNLTTAANGTVNLFAKWGAATVTLPSASRDGHTFKGWYTAPEGGTRIGSAGARVQMESDAIYYAQWEVVSYSLSLSTSENGVVANVLRSSSPYGNGQTGLLNNGAVLYYGDSLTITYTIREGYQKKQATINGADFGGDYSGSQLIESVQGDVTVVVLVKLGAIVYIGNEAYQAFIGKADGSEYVQYEAFFGNASGTEWEAY